MKHIISEAIEIRLERFRKKNRIQAESLITTVFGDAILPRGGRVSLGSMIELLQPLGVSERLVRTAVYRLVKKEWLGSVAVGRKTDYMLTLSGRTRFEEASRQIYASDIPSWDRRWRLILIVGTLGVRLYDQLRRALFWHGFGEAVNGCFVHPSADLEKVIDSLAAEGLNTVRANVMLMVAINPKVTHCATDMDMVHKAWDLSSLATSYENFLEMYEPIHEALKTAKAQEGVSEENAFLVRTLLIHDVRKLLLRDPQLPESLLPATWPGRRARHLCRDLYRKLLTLSERHLEAKVQLSDGTVPNASRILIRRFEFGMDLDVGSARAS